MIKSSNALYIATIVAGLLFVINYALLFTGKYMDWSYIFVAAATVYFTIVLFEELKFKYGGKYEKTQ
jgi:hypothetical protein